MKKSTWLPLALLLAGAAFYVYYGTEYNNWVENLPLIVIDALIVLALHFALKKKEKMEDERRNQH